MRRTMFVAATVVMLLLPIAPSHAAAPVTLTYQLDVVTGSGVLSNSSSFAVNAFSLVADIANRHIVRQKGALTIDGDTTECTIESVVPGCSEATLLCEDETHSVVAGVPGVSRGSLDGLEVTTGLIRMLCSASPSVAP